MIDTNKLRFYKGDWLAIGFVVLLAIGVLFFFLPSNQYQASEAQIYLNGQLLKTIDLQEDQVFTIADLYTNQITVKDQSIAITASNCPGQDCVHSGSIHSSGRTLVCLPNGLEIRIISGEADVDFVVG